MRPHHRGGRRTTTPARFGAKAFGLAPNFFLFGLGFLLAVTALGADSPLGSVPAAPTNAKVVLQADLLTYDEGLGTITGRGHVRLWYGPVTLTADTLEARTEDQWVSAQGNVVLTESTRQLRTTALDYNLQDGTAHAQDIRLASDPWFYRGETVDRSDPRHVVIRRSLFTTCRAEHPHYYVTADRIEIDLKESFTAYNAVFHIGTTPLFYLPWFSRNFKDNRPPFSIRMGYNNWEGLWARLRFNYFLQEEDYGGVYYNFMEKRGFGLGLDHTLGYQLGGHGLANLSLFMVNDHVSRSQRYSANFQNRLETTPRDLVQLNLDYLSDSSFNQDYSSGLVDNFQQKSYLNYSHRGNNTYWSAGILNTMILDPVTQVYYPVVRELPSASFTLNSLQLGDWPNPLYLGLNTQWTRGFEATLDNYTRRFRDTYSVTPTLTETLVLPRWVPTRPSLSASLSLPMNGSVREASVPGYAPDEAAPTAWFTGGYSTSLTLTNNWVSYQRTTPTHLLQSRLSHTFGRSTVRWNQPSLLRAGVTNDHLGLGLDYTLGNVFTLQTNTGYNLLDGPDYEHWQTKMDPFTLSSRAQLAPAVSLTAQGTYLYEPARWISAFLSAAATGPQWNGSLNASYSYRDFSPQPHVLFATVNTGYFFPIGVGVQTALQYNVTASQLEHLAITLTRDVHCWSLQGGYRYYQNGGMEIGFSINLKAFPQLKAGTGGVADMNLGDSN